MCWYVDFTVRYQWYSSLKIYIIAEYMISSQIKDITQVVTIKLQGIAKANGERNVLEALDRVLLNKYTFCYHWCVAGIKRRRDVYSSIFRPVNSQTLVGTALHRISEIFSRPLSTAADRTNMLRVPQSTTMASSRPHPERCESCCILANSMNW